MTQGFRKLPPPKSLLAFEASARNLSFTEAGKEMNVTRVAVSRQVRQLENFLGIRLFMRGQNSVKLTRAGRKLSRVLNTGFQAIMDEIEAIENTQEDNLVTLATTTGVSTYLLMPTIGRFRQINSNADFRLLVSDELINLTQYDVDLAIRYGAGNWSGMTSVLLQRQYVAPLCSASFLKYYGPFKSLSDLSKASLLEYESAVDVSSIWMNFFRDKGAILGQSLRMNYYDSYTNFVQATLDGHGIGLLGAPLMQQFLDSGVLVPAIEIEPIPQQGYYLCQPDVTSSSSTVVAFRKWIGNELCKTKPGIR